jgi:hypothetical protein
MGCCGQHRNAGGSTALPHRPTAGVAALPGPSLVWPLPAGGSAAAGLRAGGAAPPGVPLRCRDRTRMLVRGPATGRAYEFSAAQPVQAVDARDAEPLLRTRLFMRAA